MIDVDCDFHLKFDWHKARKLLGLWTEPSHYFLFKRKYRISYTATQLDSAGVKAPARVKLTLRGIAEHSYIPSMTAPPEKHIMSDLNDERLFWY